MRIGELASRTGVSVRSLRYYEEQHLLRSTRSDSGQRHYTDSEVERVDFIQRMFTAGLSSRTILELMPCIVSPSQDTNEAAFDRLIEERDRLSDHISVLMATRDSLDVLIVANRHRQQSLTELMA